MTTSATQARVLHCIADEATLTAEQLAHRLASLGRNLSHEVAGVDREQWRKASTSAHAFNPVFVSQFPSLSGAPGPGRLMSLANAIKPYDLVLTYGWSAIDVAMAHTLFKDAMGLPPLIHHESVLVGEEKRISTKRKWYRRIALGKAAGLVVPSERLEGIALTEWQQPLGRVKHFPPGVAVPGKLAQARPDALRGLIKRDGECWIGAHTASGTAQQNASLIAMLLQLPEEWHLVFRGDGTQGDSRDALQQHAEEAEVSHRVHFSDGAEKLSSVASLFDIYVATQSTPEALSALASELPLLSVDGSDIAALLPSENQAVLAASPSTGDLAKAALKLAGDSELRERIGRANRNHAQKTLSEDKAIDRYRRLYASALGMEIRA